MSVAQKPWLITNEEKERIPSSAQTFSPISPPPTGIEPAELLLWVVHTVS
jgi:hypothetical protein